MDTNNEVDNADAVAPTKSLFAGNSAPVLGAEAAEPVEHPMQSAVVEEPHVKPATESVEVPAEPEASAAEPLETVEPSAVEDTSGEAGPVEHIEAEPVDAGSVEETPAVSEANDDEAPFESAPVNAAPAAEPEAEKPLKELLSEQEKLNAKIAEKQAAEKKQVIDQIAVVVKTYSISVAELAKALGGVPNPRKGTKAPVLFSDGKNNWTGRGKTPNWLKDKNPEDYRVG